MATLKERRERYQQAEKERQAKIRQAEEFKALIDSHPELGLRARIYQGEKVGVWVRQADDRMERLMERKSWTIPAEELQKLDDKEKEQLMLDMEKA